MSNEITTQSTIISSSEEAQVAEQAAQTETQAVQTAEQEAQITAQEARQKRIALSQALLKQLAQAYPTIFPQPKDGRPVALAIGIHKQLIPIITEWGFSSVNLRSALAWYTKQLRYQQAILHASHRTNLDGSQAEEIDDAHRALAKENITKIEAYLAKKNPERAKKQAMKQKNAKKRPPKAVKARTAVKKRTEKSPVNDTRSLDEKMQSLLNKFNQ